MSDNETTVAVELSPPRGKYLAATCSAIELRTVEGTVDINPRSGNVLSLMKATEITLRRGEEFLSFRLENATANLKDGRLIVLAENIRCCNRPSLLPAAT